MSRTKTRTGHRAGVERRQCGRYGCPRLISGRRRGEFCSSPCSAMAWEMGRAERLNEALGDTSPKVTEMLAELVAVSRGWTEYLQAKHKLYLDARAVGMTEEQWHQLLNGEHYVPVPSAAQSVGGSSSSSE